MDGLLMKQLSEFGLAAAAMGLLAILIKWTTGLARDVIKHSREQQEVWRRTIEEFTSTLKVQHDQTVQAHRYQESEHRSMVDSMGTLTQSIANLAGIMHRINGVKS